MSSNVITLDKSNTTVAAVATNIRATLRSAKVYSAYVAEFGVTRDTVKDHASALAFIVYPKSDGKQTSDGKRTPFGNAVQAAAKGLREALDPKPSTTSTALLTTLGKEASLDDVVAAWHAAQS